MTTVAASKVYFDWQRGREPVGVKTMRRANKRLLNAVVSVLAETAATPARRSADIHTISPTDLRAADESVQRCEREWRGAGSPRVTEGQVSQALQNARALQEEFGQVKRKCGPSPSWVYLSLVRLFVLTRLPGLGKAKVIGGTAVVACCLSLLSTPFLFSSLPLALEGATVLTVCGICLTAPAVLVLWPTEPKRFAYQRLRQQRKEWAEQVEALRPATDLAWADYKRLHQQRTLCGRLEKARLKQQELVALLASAKYQLIHTDWRSMRGTDLERFLSRAFEMLGYHVELTNVSGDQGVDLMVTGKGKRVAVQVKGYAGSVGNDSVQQVVAGVNFYQCDSCAVITNSRFTPAAERLAAANNCRLIDGARIPDLIEGHIY